MAIISVVFAQAYPPTTSGGLFRQWFQPYPDWSPPAGNSTATGF